MKQATVLSILAAIAFSRWAGATGLLIPEDRAVPPLAIQNLRVSAKVESNVATTRVSQVFVNSTTQRLEATYIFPLPSGAALTDFAMFINGKRQSGEVVEAEKARRVYEDIVRRLRDPGLLEYLDSNLLRMRVFPIEPKSSVTVEVSYTHPLPFESGVYEYSFPLKIGSRASKVQEDFTISVDVASDQPIKNVYSPTHDVGVSRKDDHHALAGFEKTGYLLDTDFSLFYALSREDFGLSLLTHRREGQDGYFAVMISPRVELADQKVMAKDVCFVIDTSGSMQQENRIGSARDAVKFCLNALNPRDRFALVTFSTGVEVFGSGLTEAAPKAVAEAVAYVDKIEARGGTDLCGATLKALEMATGEGRPYLVVLVTDGKPTVGVTDPQDIVSKVSAANKRNVRVFSFGIAEDLNVPLLDRIAESTNSYSEYVAPGREIEAKISGFFRKVSYPVLSALQLSFGKIKVQDVYPQQLPDLFRGSQVIAFGRYSGSGDVAVALTGTVEGQKKEFAYDASFPQAQAANGFLMQLWAKRKISYLLDQIRLHGKSDELVDEVVRLSKEYGIATPYTSYLVLDSEQAYKDHGIMRSETLGALRGAGVASAPAAPAALPERAAAAQELAVRRDMLEKGSDMGGAAGPAEARASINFSEDLKRDKYADATTSERPGATATIKRVGDRTFLMVGGSYIDTAFKEDMQMLKLKWGSDAYFAVLDAMPELKDCLALGESIVVVIGNKALVIAGEGKEQMSAAEIKAFFGK
jgi:Ca-activated chloride channel family protein